MLDNFIVPGVGDYLKLSFSLLHLILVVVEELLLIGFRDSNQSFLGFVQKFLNFPEVVMLLAYVFIDLLLKIRCCHFLYIDLIISMHYHCDCFYFVDFDPSGPWVYPIT